jgi:glycosyltransferase involved in cell wall biosynthesis
LLFKRSAIAHYIKTHEIDLVHAHLPWAGFVARSLKLNHDIPVIYTEHNKQERYHWLTRTINKYTFNQQDMAISVSDDVRSSIEVNICPRIPVKTVLNGINTESFQRSEEHRNAIRHSLGILPSDVVIGSIGVFRAQKRLDRWLELIVTLTSTFPNVKGLLVGDGPLKNDIIVQRNRLGLDNIVFMPGLQTNTLDWYSAMDIFLMTSEFEGLPLALLEAMSCQLPVVTTAAGGIPEVVRHGKEGFLSEEAQWKELVPHLAQLIVNSDEREQIGIAARQRVKKHFSITQMVHQLEDLYETYAHTRRN